MNESEALKLKRNLTALVEFSRVVNSSLDLKFTLNNLLFSCMGKFLTTKGLICLIENGKLVIGCSKGIKDFENAVLPLFNEGTEVLNHEVILFCKKYDLVQIEIIKSSRGDLGFMALGEKISRQNYSDDEKEFLKTILNIASTAIENATFINELKIANRSLDFRINRLSSLFELSKEFGLLIDEGRISKLLVYSLLGQFLVSSYAIVYFEDKKTKVLESTVPKNKIKDIIDNERFKNLQEFISSERVQSEYPELLALKFDIVIPMKIGRETNGLILLGKRINNLLYEVTDIEFINSVGSLAIISLENRRLFNEALEKQKMEEELELAKDIQRNLLPKTIPQFTGFSIAGTSVSSKQVGGDYFDIIKKDENSFFVAIADVSGKGVPASLLMANLQAFLKSICTQDIPIEKATGTINDLVSENTTDGKFITFFWGVFDTVAKTFSYVNAGHNPPLLIRDGKIIYLDKGGMILGVMKTIFPYETETIAMQEGDLLVLFTDGVTEAKNTADEEYGDETLEELVMKHKDKSSEEILDEIKNAVHNFTSGALQSDDITIIVVKAG
ncbi:MAG: PP2C family protein-serine/threonine phosphatase [Ignavibacteriaceae bacterium]|nr:PP2C family protein-serine/threonine phosphatase [Ignavibacteriaceae bacterium]